MQSKFSALYMQSIKIYFQAVIGYQVSALFNQRCEYDTTIIRAACNYYNSNYNRH